MNAKDDTGATPLHTAVTYMQQPVITALLDVGAQPNLVDDEGQTPLHLAAIHNSSLAPDVISILLKRGAGAPPFWEGTGLTQWKLPGDGLDSSR